MATAKSKTYKSTLMKMPGGGTVGFREVSKSDPPTIDVNIQGVNIKEIKFEE
jgi:hypothetical protein